MISVIKRIKTLLNNLFSKPNKFRPLVLLVTFIFVGSIFIYLTQAATSSVSIEVESGNFSSGASSVANSSASAGSYARFMAPSAPTSEAFHTCYPHAFCDSNNNPVIMNGFNIRDADSATSGYLTSFSNLTQLQKIKAKGFNVIRIAFQWSVFQPSAGTSGFSTTAFNNLRTIVNNAKSAGLYVILDPIHGTGRGAACSGTDGKIPTWAHVTVNGSCGQRIGAIKANAKDYIQKVATDYATEPNVIAIDLANEIQSINYTDDVELLGMYNQLINHVRAVDQDKILIIEPQAGERLLTANAIANTITNKSNIIYSSHDYFGGAYNSSGTLISGCLESGYGTNNSSCSGRNSTDAGGTGYVNPAKNKLSLEARVVTQLNMLADPRVQMPLYIGEYDCPEGLTNYDQWFKDIVGIYKKYNLSRTQWLFYNRGSSYPGDPPAQNHSAAAWTSSSNDTPGAFKPWVDLLL